MRPSRDWGAPSWASLCLVLLGSVGCESDPGVVPLGSTQETDDDEECTPGEERCECDDGDCDDGLVCRSDLCVADEDDDEAEPEPDADDDAAPSPVAATDDDTADEPTGDDDLTPVVEPIPEPSMDDDVASDDDVTPEPASGGASGTGGTPAMGGSGAGPVVATGGTTAEGGSATGGQAPVGQAGAPSQPFDDGVLENGDFSSGDLHWRIYDESDGVVNYSTSTGSLCVVVGPTEPFVSIGWPLDSAEGVVLDAASYELSYDAWATDPSLVYSFQAKAGEAVTPYLEHFLETLYLSSSSSRYGHTFSPSSLNPSGIVFLIYNVYSYDTTVCVDNVALRAL